MKLIMQTVPVSRKCKLCEKIELKMRRRAAEVERLSRCQREGKKYRVSTDKSMEVIRGLDAEIYELNCERNRRLQGIGIAEESKTDPKDGESQLPLRKGARTSQEEREQIIKGFAHAIAEKFRNRQLEFSTSFVSQERAKQVFTSKLERYYKVIADDTPQTIEFMRKRNAAETVFQYRAEIVNEFVRVAFPAPEQEQEAKRSRTVWTNETIQESSEEKASTWCIDSTGFYEDLPYPVDAHDIVTTQKSDEAMDIYASVELQSVDDPDPTMEREHKAIREHLTTHEKFDILESALEKVARHYYGDTMKLIQTSILGTPGASTACFTANFQAKWNVREFIEEQYGSELQDIRHILTITGNCHDAQMTTVGCYLKQTWPVYPNALIDKLQLLILGSYLNEQKDGMTLRSALSFTRNC